MLDMLKELYHHQEWADAEHWRAFRSHPIALEDTAIRQRLHHIHLVQQAFLSLARGEPVNPTKLEDFESMASLRAYAREHHQRARAFLAGLEPFRLHEMLIIPWFKEPPIRITLAQALMQATMHSHYHRAQNAARLRELGGEPPLTDLILWYWKERPPATWE